MFPDSLFMDTMDDDHGVEAKICDYFFNKDAEYGDVILDPAIQNEYLKAIEQFRAYCDPYSVIYRFPAMSRDMQANIRRIREFFAEVRAKVS